ncbi:MAG: LPS export ABC transporter periplasmic protein LptC [Gemmatimonadetes bacterium]|nr:LPS export ABC transporter periplasmic protein LptC [Gemmatimonadota bacterium]
MFARLTALAVFGFAAVAAGCSGPERPPTAATVGDTADQVVFGLKHQLTMDGVLRTRVAADTAYFYQSSQKATMRHITVTFYSPEGKETSTLTADGGIYEWRTGNMEARGHVVAVTPDRRRLNTGVLSYNRDTGKIIGPEAFVFDSPERHLEGEGFVSDPDFKDVVTQRPKRGTLGKVELGG